MTKCSHAWWRGPIVLGMVGAFCIAASAIWLTARHRSPTSETALGVASSSDPFRPPGEPDRPYREVSADHRPKRVQHKDATGLSPLELVETPQGTVRVQRTFSTDGRLLKEEAFLDGKPVPVPARQP